MVCGLQRWFAERRCRRSRGGSRAQLLGLGLESRRTGAGMGAQRAQRSSLTYARLSTLAAGPAVQSSPGLRPPNHTQGCRCVLYRGLVCLCGGVQVQAHASLTFLTPDQAGEEGKESLRRGAVVAVAWWMKWSSSTRTGEAAAAAASAAPSVSARTDAPSV